MVTIAISSWPCKYPDDLIDLARSTAFRGIEWDLNYIPLPLSPVRRTSLFKALNAVAVSVRFHFPYSTFDIGSSHAAIRHVAEVYFSYLVDLLAESGPFHSVIHLGGSSGEGYNLDALLRLVERANQKGGSIAIENLLFGPTSDPRVLREIALASGSSVALDVGHARTAGRLEEYLAIVGDLVTHVHFYDFEDERLNHMPFSDAKLAMDVASLVLGFCKPAWWTLELDSQEACSKNREMIEPLWAEDRSRA